MITLDDARNAANRNDHLGWVVQANRSRLELFR